MEIIFPVIILGALGLIFGLGLAFASKKFEVKTDHRLEAIVGLLPGANCGACGGAGCFGFAEAVLKGEKSADQCRAASQEAKEKIAALLGKKAEKKEKLVARLKCFGGSKVKDKYIYTGPHDCVYASQLLKGRKECSAGCIGFGTCVSVCPFDAIKMADNGLPVVDEERCKACAKCVAACPKKLFILQPKDKPVHVACSLKLPGRETKSVCPAGCIACKLCEKACKEGAIKVTDNLAEIDYAKCTSCGACVKVCPAKAIRKA